MSLRLDGVGWSEGTGERQILLDRVGGKAQRVERGSEIGAISLLSHLTLPQSQLGICDPTIISCTRDWQELVGHRTPS